MVGLCNQKNALYIFLKSIFLLLFFCCCIFFWFWQVICVTFFIVLLNASFIYCLATWTLHCIPYDRSNSHIILLFIEQKRMKCFSIDLYAFAEYVSGFFVQNTHSVISPLKWLLPKPFHCILALYLSTVLYALILFMRFECVYRKMHISLKWMLTNHSHQRKKKCLQLELAFFDFFLFLDLWWMTDTKCYLKRIISLMHWKKQRIKQESISTETPFEIWER